MMMMLWRIGLLFTAFSSRASAMALSSCDRRACWSKAIASDHPSNAAYRIEVLERPPDCKFQSQRGDILEIVYEAHMYSEKSPVYDASIQRGTGQPYQMVLGSGDVLPGVDLGLYDMCPGEVRTLFLPPALAYGSRGNRLYRIPPDTPLYWSVQLISIQSFQRQEDEEE